MTGFVSVIVQGHKIKVRPTDSDLFVLSQIFGWEEYKIDPHHLARLYKVAEDWQASGIKPLIVDAGANVGYSALYFATLFPSACIVAIEPDPNSFKILSDHTRPKSNIMPVHAALWSHDRGLRLQSSNNDSWSTQVGEGTGTPSKRLDVLITSIPNARVLIIKLDIEGAEREVIESCPEVFAETKCIMVEPHDFMNHGAACLFPLYQVAAKRKFDTLINGENLMLFALD